MLLISQEKYIKNVVNLLHAIDFLRIFLSTEITRSLRLSYKYSREMSNHIRRKRNGLARKRRRRTARKERRREGIKENDNLVEPLLLNTSVIN